MTSKAILALNKTSFIEVGKEEKYVNIGKKMKYVGIFFLLLRFPFSFCEIKMKTRINEQESPNG